MSRRRIYVASSWRNMFQPRIVSLLREVHDVYDFRNPRDDNYGFSWSEVDRDWLTWQPATFVEKLVTHPAARRGYQFDKQALDWCDTCILVLPCGRSAHLEAGYTIGQGKPTGILLHEDRFEPELMYLLAARLFVREQEVFDWVADLAAAGSAS